ncbi:MAG: polysaccharide deacetylase family protein [Bacillota bacterium]
MLDVLKAEGATVRTILKRVAAAVMPSRPRAGTPILAYHSIHPTHPLAVKPREFRLQVEWLVSHYRVVPLCEYLKRKRAGTLEAGTAAVTFDDGYQDNYTQAYPVLKEFECPATLFVPTRFVECAGALGAELGLFQGLEPLTWDQMLKMSDLVEIGAHTHSHVQLSRVSLDILERELIANLEVVYRRINRVPRFFSYPWGQRQDLAAGGEALLRRFFDGAVTTLFGADNRAHRISPFRLRRVMVGPDDDLAVFAAKASGGLDRVVAFRDILTRLHGGCEQRNHRIHV